MENNKKNLRSGLAVLIVLVLVIGVAAVVVTKVPKSNDSVENPTDMADLKSSKFTSDAFEKVELGDSKSDVESKMGKLNSIDIDLEYDVYTVLDGDTEYYFYFDGDSLANLSIFLKNKFIISKVSIINRKNIQQL